MGGLNMAYARFPHGVATKNPTLPEYIRAASYLEVEVKAAEADGLELQAAMLRAKLASYRSVIRKLRWKLQLSEYPRF